MKINTNDKEASSVFRDELENIVVLLPKAEHRAFLLQMASIISEATSEIVVIKCHIAKTAGLKMTRELNSAPTANNPCMTRVAGALAVTAAMGRIARNTNALDSPTAVSSSVCSSV